MKSKFFRRLISNYPGLLWVHVRERKAYFTEIAACTVYIGDISFFSIDVYFIMCIGLGLKVNFNVVSIRSLG